MIAKAISRRSSTGFELEFCQEVLDSILDYYLKENSNVHTMHMMTGVKALYYTRLGPGQDLVSQEKVNEFMGLVSSSFVKDFDAISGENQHFFYIYYYLVNYTIYVKEKFLKKDQKQNFFLS